MRISKIFLVALAVAVICLAGMFVIRERGLAHWLTGTQPTDQASSHPASPAASGEQVQPGGTTNAQDPQQDKSSAAPESSAASSQPTVGQQPLPAARLTIQADEAKDVMVLVNKQRMLPSDYVPPDLVEVKIPFSFEGKSPKKMMREEAAEALEKLFAQAAKEHIKLAGVSAYRSYATQTAIFNDNAKRQGVQEANKTSAIPGQSEHQTGLAIDVSSPSVNFALEESFGDTVEGKWLAENAPKFGFIIRYPKGKEAVTGYSYEPWHIRYVGVQIAEEIAAKGITLEEYYASQHSGQKG